MTTLSPTQASLQRKNVTESEQECQVMVTSRSDEKQKLKKHERAGNFDIRWKESMAWTYREHMDGGMFCNLCQKYEKTPFAQDCDWRAWKITNSPLNTEIQYRPNWSPYSEWKCGRNKSKEISKENMVKEFQCLYFLCKNNIYPHHQFWKVAWPRSSTGAWN